METREERIARAREHWLTRASRRAGEPMPMGLKETLQHGTAKPTVGYLLSVLAGCSGKTARRIQRLTAARD